MYVRYISYIAAVRGLVWVSLHVVIQKARKYSPEHWVFCDFGLNIQQLFK